MADKTVPRMPASIDQAALGDALESLGISLRPALLKRVVLDVRHAELTYEATAEDGEPIVVDGHLATVTYHVPITTSPASDHAEPAIAAAVEITVLEKTLASARENARLVRSEGREPAVIRHWSAVSGWLRHRIRRLEAGANPDWLADATSDDEPMRG